MKSSKKIMLAAAVLLLAAVLFVGAGAAAATVTDADTLVTALGGDNFAKKEADGSVTLLADVTLTDTIDVNSSAADLTLNLNGHTISGDVRLIQVTEGKLKITGTGILTGGLAGSSVLGVYGSASDVADFSNLTIDTNVKVIAKNCYALVIGHKSNAAYGASVILKGYLTVINDDAVTTTDYGVITASGNINKKTGTYFPTLTLDGCQVVNEKEMAIYIAGYVSVDVKNTSTVTGTTGIYVKSGKLTITDSTVSGTGTAANPDEQHSGASSTGDAIIMDSTTGYAGKIDVTISGTSKIHSTNGYALQEATLGQAPSAAVGIAISGGDLQGGKDGIKTSDALKSKEDRNTIVQITGGTIHQTEGSPETTAYSSMPAHTTPFIPGPKTGNTKVTMTASADYNLIIPAEVKLSSGNAVHASVALTFILVPNSNDGGIDVTVTGTTKPAPEADTKAFKMTNANGAAAYFNIASEESMAVEKQYASGAKVLAGQTADASQDVYFKLTADGLPESGAYAGTLTFAAGPAA